MADEADITASRDEREVPMRIAASRQPEGPPPNGRCQWCDEIVGDTQRYCDTSCRDDHERFKRHQKIGGLRE